MSIKTKIQWCDSTVNPTMGCDGCEIWDDRRKTCYAGSLHVRFGGSTVGYAPTFEDVTMFPGRMAEAARWPDLTGKPRADKPWLNGMPRIIFVSDMSDALSLAVSFEFLHAEIVEIVSKEPGNRHQWLWLTKRPNRMAEFSRWLAARGTAWPVNLWAGTSVTSRATTSRIRHLLDVGDSRTMRFLSVEPQVEFIDLDRWLPGLDWIIQGGESGRKARPFDLAWADSMIERTRALGVPLFLKQLGSLVVEGGVRVSFRDNHAGDWSEWPDRLRARTMPVLPKPT
jgi:protein gp37